MSSPASGLESLSLKEIMPLRTRESDQSYPVRGPSGRLYDLSIMPPAQGGIAHDGLSAERIRLMPVLTKATYPESGFIGFEVTETHSVRVPLSDDHGEGSSDVQCNCPTFRRTGMCNHIVWLYDGLQASLETSPASPQSASAEKFSESLLWQRLSEMAAEIPQQARGLAERINRLQPHQLPEDEIDRAILDAFSVFDGHPDGSPRKRRRPEDSPDEVKPAGPKLRTCLEISPDEFFADIQRPENDIRDVVVSGNLLATFKGLVRYGTVIRESFLAVIDSRFRADDFLNRLDNRLGEWKERWENFRKDRRTTVPSSFITDYAGTVREVVRQMKEYEEDRNCPDSFHDHAIDIGITLLDELCKSNADLYEGHSRQNSQAPRTIPAHHRDRNLFTNLVSDPPSGQTGFVRSFVEMLFQFGPEKLDDVQVKKLRQLLAELTEMDSVQSHLISPLKNLLQHYDTVASSQSQALPQSPQDHQLTHGGSAEGQSQSRRYRELRAAPSSS